MEYNFKKIESKWQKKWAKEKIYEVKENLKKDKFYCLIEFPYPSGEGLHVGHPRSYTALDIVARKNRMQGKNVLYPIGWDAYGLPTENYAIKTGIQPAVATEKNIKNFTRQLKSLGFSFDWSREINTTDPEYYKWTQWMFLQFFKHGLAYKDKIAINWCTKCKIGLANEEVVNGVCERCGGTVVKKMKEQWMIKITKYAERLLQGLENVDYSPRIKEGQINWIGKSEGAEVDFRIKTGKINLGEKHSSKKIDKMFEVLDQINNALSKEKIKVWFNGTFGVAGYYGYIFDDPRDVDCGVLIKDFDKARKIIENLGYKKIEDKENPKFRVSIYDVGGFTLEIGTFDHDLGDKIVELEGYKFRVPEPHWFAECYRITAPKERRIGKNDALRAEFLESIYGDKKIKVFTTRPDTLFGATYMVLAPEHEIISKIKNQISNIKEVEEYIEKAKRKSDLERTELQKEKTGVELRGVKAINPVNNEEIPIWVADYVLIGYGTGAIMAVPAHDERDFEFAKKYKLKIKPVFQEYLETWDETTAQNGKLMDGSRLTRRTFNPNKEDAKIDGDLLLALKRKACDDLNQQNAMAIDGEGWIFDSGVYSGYHTKFVRKKIVEDLENNGIAKKTVNYKLRDWVFSRQRYWGEPIPLVYCENCAKKKQKILLIHGLTGRADKNWIPWMKQQLENIGFEVFTPTMTTTEHPVLEKWMEELLPIVKNFGEDDVIVGHSLGGKATLHLMERVNKKINNIFLVAPAVGKMTDEELAAKKVKRPEKDYDTARIFWEKDLNWAKIKKNVGNATIIYSDNDKSVKLYGYEFWPSDWTIKHVGNYNHFTDKEYPVLFDVIRNSRLTGWQPVPEKDLPVELPKVKKYEPTDIGESPLAAIEKWVATKCPKCGGPARRETDTMPNWAGSSWYFLRYADPKNKKEFASEKSLKYFMPVDWYNGGMEHTTLHLLYSRFWYKFLYDIGVIPKECGDEPYKKRTSHGLILGEGGEKMSKSRGNVVNPDDVVTRFGADTLRVYEMFMGPFEQAIPWDEKGVVGVFRFLERIWKLGEKVGEKNENKKIEKILYQTIKKVGEDIEQMKFNTAVSALMILTNELSDEEKIGRDEFNNFLKILAPFSPHLAEELWEKLGNRKSIHLAEWPKYNPAKILEEEIDLIVQVNGKMRDSIKIKADIGEEEAKKIATESEKIKKWIEGQKIKKIIFVKGRLVNIVV